MHTQIYELTHTAMCAWNVLRRKACIHLKWRRFFSYVYGHFYICTFLYMHMKQKRHLCFWGANNKQIRVTRALQCVAVCCSVLPCVAVCCVCCSVLQCVVICCCVLQCVAVCCSVLQCVVTCCSVLQCVAVCCSVLQCVAVWNGCPQKRSLHTYGMKEIFFICMQRYFSIYTWNKRDTYVSEGETKNRHMWLGCCSVLQCVAVCCSVLSYVAVCCSVLQCVAVCCSVLQCVVICCSVLQCVAACCSVLQYVAVCCSVMCVAVCCYML